MRWKETGYTKIGQSKNPAERVRGIRGSMMDVELIHVFQGDRVEEQMLHDKYAHRRVRGEWYDLTNDDISEIAATMQADDVPILKRQIIDTLTKFVNAQERDDLLALRDDVERLNKRGRHYECPSIIGARECQFVQAVDDAFTEWASADPSERPDAESVIDGVLGSALWHKRWEIVLEEEEPLTDGGGI